MTWSADPAGPIGVVAEGWEGVRGAELLRAQLPKEDLVVVADQAFAPYAKRRPDQIVQRVQDLAVGLLDEGAKALLLASGFASFEARPETEGIALRGLECGLRAAL
ncbi:MAG: glutamate racemase, partial [Actinobacteria bacterium]|nr:glutamate racemase [Actinomycetota bacterium]